MKLTDLVKVYNQSFSSFWALREARERLLLIVVFASVSFGLIYALLIYPALSGRKQLSEELPLLRQQVALMQALSKEAAELSDKPRIALAPINKVQIESSLSRNGLKLHDLLITGDYLKVQLDAVSFAGMVTWLDDIQKTFRLSVVDANISSLNQPDNVDAALTLRQVRNE